MDRNYRIDGAGSKEVFLEASQMAESALIEQAGVGSTVTMLSWATYILASAGASGLCVLLLIALQDGQGVPPTGWVLFLCIAAGVSTYLAVVFLLNRSIGRATARAYLTDPLMQNHHVMLSSEGLKVVDGRSYTLFHWGDVTRIEASPGVILVMAGPTWTYIPLAAFVSGEEAKAALSDMRQWQAEARR